MAHKLRCPKCDRVLKEEGDLGKSAQAEYRVFDSAYNCKHPAGTFCVIMCLGCRETGPIDYFDSANAGLCSDEQQPLVSDSGGSE